MNSHSPLRKNWHWLAAGALLTFSSSFGQTFFISVFAGEFQREFSLSHGAWGGLFMVATLGSAMAMVFTGALTDKLRTRVIAGGTLALLACACIVMSKVTSVVALTMAIFALRLLGQGMASHTAVVAMARWFVETRGRALAITSFGMAIGEALLPLTFVSLIAWAGWRESWMLAACIAAVLILPILLFLRNEPTATSGIAVTGCVGMAGRHWTRAQVIRSPLFWCIVPTLVGPPAFVTAFFFLQAHLAASKGWTHIELVSLFPIHTVCAVIAMTLSGFAIDRFGADRLMQIYTLPLAIGFLLFSMADTVQAGAVAIAAIALTSGTQIGLPAAFWSELYGSQHLGSIKAMATSLMVLGSAIGPGLTGLIIDNGIEFNNQLPAISVYLVLAAMVSTIGIQRSKGT